MHNVESLDRLRWLIVLGGVHEFDRAQLELLRSVPVSAGCVCDRDVALHPNSLAGLAVASI